MCALLVHMSVFVQYHDSFITVALYYSLKLVWQSVWHYSIYSGFLWLPRVFFGSISTLEVFSTSVNTILWIFTGIALNVYTVCGRTGILPAELYWALNIGNTFIFLVHFSISQFLQGFKFFILEFFLHLWMDLFINTFELIVNGYVSVISFSACLFVCRKDSLFF